MKTKLAKILIGLSGGVDSAVAAFLLQKQGHEVEAAFMKNFSQSVNANSKCPWKDDYAEAQKVAKILNIKLHFWDFEPEYQNTVVKYLFDSYQAGLTPNPDILCNSEIKFKLFLNKAIRAGFAKIATGHYAQVKKSGKYFELLKGKDQTKNQVYFLAGLNQRQLRHVLFPLGKLTKLKVRQIAKTNNLPNADRKDSQGICFVGKVKLRDFLKQKIEPKSGDIVNTKGEIMGQHEGVFYYTIGQRKGIDVSDKQALYVIDKNIKHNKLVVGYKDDINLYNNEIIVSDWHWIGKQYKFPLTASGQIRYRQADQKLKVIKLNNNQYKVSFKNKQFAIAAGQILAVYKGSKLIASATIN